VKLKLLQFAGPGIQHTGSRDKAVGSPVEIIEAEFEVIRGVVPRAAKWMILAYNQLATWLQDTSGFPVIAPQIGNSHRDMAPGKDDIESCVIQPR
jgi:hypothetical protein